MAAVKDTGYKLATVVEVISNSKVVGSHQDFFFRLVVAVYGKLYNRGGYI